MKPLFYLSSGRRYSAALLFCLAALTLAACSDSNSNRRKPADAGYLQFYNASQNSSTTDFVITQTLASGDTNQLVSKVEFGDASPSTAVTPDDYQLTFERTDPFNLSDTISIFERDLTVAKDDRSLWIMTGDYASPDLMEYRYTQPTSYNNGEFGVTVFNVTDGRGQIELYYAPEDGSFAEAQFLVTLGENVHSDPVTLAAGNYIFFAVDVDSGDRILTTESVPFIKAQSYFLMLREVGFGDGSSIVLDQVSNSSFVYSYENQDASATAQVRGYNSINDLGSVDITLAGDGFATTIAALDVDRWSNFFTLDGGDYAVSLSDVGVPDSSHISGLSLSMLAGKKKNIFFYRDTASAVKALAFDQQERSRLYESDINLVSLVNLLNDDGARYYLKAYFVNEAGGEVFRDPTTNEINTTIAQVLTKVDFAQLRSFPLVVGEYVVYFTYTTSAVDADNNTVLTENDFTAPVSLTIEAGKNYLLTLEPDALATDGYQLNISL